MGALFATLQIVRTGGHPQAAKQKDEEYWF
jgi:hypothetical protein